MVTAEQSPFRYFRIRGLILSYLLIILPLVLPLRWIGAWIGLEGGDPATVWFALNWVYALVLVLTIWRLHRSRISLRRLIGRVPRGSKWLASIYVVVPLTLFAVGAGYLVYLPLSFILPRFVESVVVAGGPILCYSPSETRSMLLCNCLCVGLLLILAPVAEELVFRGVLLQRLVVKWGNMRALVFSCLAFAIIHQDVIGGFVFGCVMVVIYAETRTLIVPIFCHSVCNAVALAGDYLTTRWFAPSTTYSLQELRSQWWLGAICLAISLPWVILFIRRNLMQREWCLPDVGNASSNYRGEEVYSFEKA